MHIGYSVKEFGPIFVSVNNKTILSFSFGGESESNLSSGQVQLVFLKYNYGQFFGFRTLVTLIRTDK